MHEQLCSGSKCKNYLQVVTCHIWDICWFDMFLTETSKNESSKMIVTKQVMTFITKTQFSVTHFWFLPSYIKSYLFLKMLIFHFIFGFFSLYLSKNFYSFFCMFLLLHILLSLYLSLLFSFCTFFVVAYTYKQNFSYQQFTGLEWPKMPFCQNRHLLLILHYPVDTQLLILRWQVCLSWCISITLKEALYMLYFHSMAFLEYFSLSLSTQV